MAQSAPITAESRPVAGILWMLLTGANFVAVTAIVKHVGSGLPAAESAFLRYLLGLVFLIPMARPLMAAKFTRKILFLYGIRGIAHALGVILWFYAMTRITMAEVTSLAYLNPIYVTIGAIFLLGEKVALRRILAICVALVGALVILRPGFRELSPGHFAMLANALLFGGSYLIAKVMSDQSHPAVVVAMLSITVTIGLAPFAWVVWVPPSLEDLGWMFLVACFATAGHYTMTLALASAPVTVTQPVTFLQLVWAMTLGALVFGEPIDIWVVFGGAIIIGAVSFITWREAMLKRRAITPSVPATKG